MISVVTSTRNDAYDGDSLHRNQAFISSLVWLAKQHKLDMELIIVEWNPPEHRPLLSKAIRWPEQKRVKIRILAVSKKIHDQVENSHIIPFFQMQAKNVGIRRAQGEWILCTNADLIYSKELVEWLAKADNRSLLNEGSYYRTTRHDTDLRRVSGTPEILFPAMVDVWLEACHNHVTTIHTPPPEGQLFTNGCGDFTMLHRTAWYKLKGYAELGRWSPHIDSLFLIAASATGYNEHRITHPIYHLRHDKALVGLDEQRQEYPYPIIDLETEFSPWASLMTRQGKCITPNGSDWGFAHADIVEIEI